jgi:Leucine-rich repeat (LRR) protein
VGELTGLTDLYIGGSSLEDVTPLGKLSKLSLLAISETQVNDISALADLRQLTFLNVSGNQIESLQPLVDNSGIGDGDAVDVSANPFNCADQQSSLDELIGRGVELTSDCP